MILTLHVPPLARVRQGLCDIVYSLEKFRKMSKTGSPGTANYNRLNNL